MNVFKSTHSSPSLLPAPPACILPRTIFGSSYYHDISCITVLVPCIGSHFSVLLWVKKNVWLHIYEWLLWRRPSVFIFRRKFSGWKKSPLDPGTYALAVRIFFGERKPYVNSTNLANVWLYLHSKKPLRRIFFGGFGWEQKLSLSFLM